MALSTSTACLMSKSSKKTLMRALLRLVIPYIIFLVARRAFITISPDYLDQPFEGLSESIFLVRPRQSMLHFVMACRCIIYYPLFSQYDNAVRKKVSFYDHSNEDSF